MNQPSRSHPNKVLRSLSQYLQKGKASQDTEWRKGKNIPSYNFIRTDFAVLFISSTLPSRSNHSRTLVILRKLPLLMLKVNVYCQRYAMWLVNTEITCQFRKAIASDSIFGRISNESRAEEQISGSRKRNLTKASKRRYIILKQCVPNLRGRDSTLVNVKGKVFQNTTDDSSTKDTISLKCQSYDINRRKEDRNLRLASI